MSDKDIKYQIGFSLIPRIGRVRTSQMEMKKVIPVSDAESFLLKYLDAEPTHIDEVCRSSDLSEATVSGNLAMIELKGLESN